MEVNEDMKTLKLRKEKKDGNICDMPREYGEKYARIQ